MLTTGTYLHMREILKKIMKKDSHCFDLGGYHIRSLYFDDMYDSALRDKYQGYSHRKKFRIRIYNRSDRLIKLEIKEKHQDYIHKISSPISREEYERIYDGDISFLYNSRNEVREQYYLEFRTKYLKPAVIVDYQREAFVIPFNDIRITLDKRLSAAVPEKDIFSDNCVSSLVGAEYSVIMELKYNNFFPGYLRNILEGYCSNRLAVSKYMLCREHVSRQIGM
ncbi:polyphosphate polymerase domain-containing protein [Phosphitispora sp. TUW77]|uniref:polyphosphate polymerase domain-containing protein n=1 Tax=Phosphitispora sp. TUW77 TaxID=3152361 RepID=UPI003AB3F236